MSTLPAAISCQEFVELVTPYTERRAARGSADAFERHLLVCPYCATYLDQMGETVRLLARLGEGSDPSPKSQAAARPATNSAAAGGSRRALKFLAPDRVAPFSGARWPEPGGTWIETDADPATCTAGLHACRLEALPFWLNSELWLVELDGVVEEGDLKLVAHRGRLLAPVEAWDEEAKRRFGSDCATQACEAATEVVRTVDEEKGTALAGMTIEELAAAAEAEELEKLGGGDARATAAYSYAGYAALFVDDPAPIGYVSAGAAGHARGPDGAEAERRRQADWLDENLGLSTLLDAG